MTQNHWWSNSANLKIIHYSWLKTSYNSFSTKTAWEIQAWNWAVKITLRAFSRALRWEEEAWNVDRIWLKACSLREKKDVENCWNEVKEARRVDWDFWERIREIWESKGKIRNGFEAMNWSFVKEREWSCNEAALNLWTGLREERKDTQ